MTRPLLLDAFCAQGGAAKGYTDAGFGVIGVDIDPQPNYPYPFIQADAVQFIREYGRSFDAVHASPPCQRYTHGNAAGTQADRHPDLVGPTRDALESLDVVWVMENVPRSPLRSPLTLCATMFGLTALDDDGTVLHLRRHRWFESNLLLYPPGPCNHLPGVQVAGSYGGARRDKHEARDIRHGGYVPPAHILAKLMGIDWADEHGLFQAIPPKYCEWLGTQLIDQIRAAA